MKKIKPKISTITPCYKMERYLKKFLDELPNQTAFNEMQLVIDLNDPTENELKWCQDFESKYPDQIKLLITKPVNPIGVSMNWCIKNADADVMTIWNVDDLREPNSLELQIKAFEEDPDVGVVHGNFTIVNKFGSTEGRFIDHTEYNNKKEQLRSMVLGPFFAFNRLAIMKAGGIGFDEQFKSGADFDLAIRLAATNKVAMIKENLGFYLDEGKGASTRGDDLQPLERTAIELRYGILDKVDERYLTKALQNYDIRHVWIYNNKLGVNLHDILIDYEEICKNNDLR